MVRPGATPPPTLPIRAERLRADVDALAGLTEPDRPYTRLAYSEEDRASRLWLRARMHEAGLAIRTDAAANVIGRRRGRREGPVLLVGSHLDTVPAGGRFDGMAGVVAGLEIVRALEDAGVQTEHPVEVVAFTNEEPNAFGLSTIGSRAMAGRLSADRVATMRDPSGRTLAEAVDSVGGQSARLETAARRGAEIAVYLELHIEQGPVLEATGIPVGIVTGIAGPSRARVTVRGRPDHAGTTPMAMRADSLAAAAEIILGLEEIARDQGEVVGTTGVIVNHPNHANVVPGLTELVVEYRSIRPEPTAETKRRLLETLARVRDARQVDVAHEFLMEEVPIVIPAAVVAAAEAACAELGVPCLRLPSGAGHDANHMARIAPVGMLFVPSRGGRSHCPEEWTDLADLALGVQALAATLLRLDRDPPGLGTR